MKLQSEIQRFFLTIFVLSLIFQNSISQNISFDKLGLEDGLSEIAGLCIQQDSLGRMWIGDTKLYFF